MHFKPQALSSKLRKDVLLLKQLFSNSFFLFLFIFILFNCSSYKPAKSTSITDSGLSKVWVGTWGTAPQLVEPNNMPPAPGLSNNTIRQIVRVSIGGDSVRLRFNNEFSKSPVTMNAVQIAVSKDSSVIDPNTIKNITFHGNSAVTMQPGTTMTSDPIAFKLMPRMDVAISIYFGDTSPDVTGHPGSRTTSFLYDGNKISEPDFNEAVKTDHWYVISGMDVKAPEGAKAIAILGNSITDGRGSGTNKQNRWPDVLSERLLKNPATKQVGVLNMGIGGNAVLRGGLGPTALNRFDRDVLKQHGVKWLIILIGVNDLGGTRDSVSAARVGDGLIAAYKKMIDQAHAQNILVYGATILPIDKSFYYKDFREPVRNKVNDWIRNSGYFDAVIDFDKAMSDPENPSVILPNAHSGDFLHPNELGYKLMGEYVDLGLFQ
ncbi:SGNH/GDSL hydrolase family protein [Confluentibacter sediminis]|uniref:SGNH/GDSL hydrolase family protein n=1 Tax=Confluentibacter sediminis TaxID=2219045 RepID=UPI000DAEF60B|nr:SGNH/GDSL hydrolase family protein [Confluentibacter sediminis]